MTEEGKIRFFEEVKVVLRNRRKLKLHILQMLADKHIKLDSLNVVFCNDERLLSINREFLKHDYYTDIITFDLSTKDQLTAEIYISLDRVRDNAITNKVPMRIELHRVIFHGVLHLIGLGDKTVQEKVKMRRAENKTLKLYFGETIP